MKKILKFLATLTIVMPVAISSVACTNLKPLPNPTPTPPTDLDATIKSIESIFSKNLIKELNKGNLLNEDDFTNQWETIIAYLDGIKDGTIIKTDSVLVSRFNELINQIVQNAVKEIMKNPFLASFFTNIDTKDILQLDVTNTKYDKEHFDWKNNNFGIPNFARKYLPKIKFWDKISSHLEIKMNYFDEDGKKQVYSFNQTFNFQLANKAADIATIIKLVSDNFADQLKNYNPQVNLQTQRIDFERQPNDYCKKLVDNINAKLNNKDLIIYESSVSDLSTDSNQNSGLFGRRISNILSYNTYPYLQEDKTSFATDFTNHSKEAEKDYQASLISWSQANNIKLENADSIMFYGQYSITNWSFQGLVLDPINLNFTMIENNSREKQIEKLVNVFSNLFATDGLLAKGIKDSNDGNTFSMSLNKDNFNKLKNDVKSTVGQAITYKQQEIIDTGINNKLFTKDDSFLFNTHYFGGALDSNIHNLNFNHYLNKEKNAFKYYASPNNLYMVCSFDNVFINFSKDSASNYISDFSITQGNN